MRVCTVHLVRHGQHGLLDRVLAGRMPGVGLSAAGQAEAEALGERFAGTDVRLVASSPVQRARETAGPIARRLGLAVAVEPGLEEIDFGAWSGQGFDALAPLPEWRHWNVARGLAATPAGDTMLLAQARAVTALRRLGEAGGTVVAVSHSDVIKAVLAHALGMPLDLMHRLQVAPGSRSVLVFGDDFARVEAVNLPP